MVVASCTPSDGVSTRYPENTSNIPSVFSMHDVLYSSVDWLLAGSDAACISLQ